MLIAAALIASLAVDQVGYPAHAAKFAAVSSPSFTLAQNGKIVLTGRVENGIGPCVKELTFGVNLLRLDYAGNRAART